jgi:hypothetical protein
LSITILKDCLPPLFPKKPKINIKIKGNIKLKMIDEGLLLIARKLAFVMDNIALIWLYFINRQFGSVKLTEKEEKKIGSLRQVTYLWVTNDAV